MRHGATYVPNNFMGRHRNFKTCLQQNQPKGATQFFELCISIWAIIIDQNRERERRSRTRHHYEEKEIQNMSAEARLGC